MKKLSFLLVLPFLVLTGCEQDQFMPNGSDEQMLAFYAKDFKIKWNGDCLMAEQSNGTFTCEDLPGSYEVDYQGNMKGTFIGKADLYVDGCYSSSETVNQGFAVVTSNQGSLTLSYYTTYAPEAQTEEGVLPFIGWIEIISGDGRFAGATGSGDLFTLQNINLEGMPVEYYIEGILNF